jgi:hypothetical protein
MPTDKLTSAVIIQITAVIANVVTQMTSALPVSWQHPVGAVLILIQAIHAIALLYTSPPGTFSVRDDESDK